MAITRIYNHTAKRLLSDVNPLTDDLVLALASSFTFDATDTTLAGITWTEVSGNGYSRQSLANVTVDTVTTNDALIDADNVSITASGGSIDANYALIFDNTLANDPPLLAIDFEGTESAGDGTPFNVIFPNGLVAGTVA